MTRQHLLIGLAFALAACVAPPMHWEKPGGSADHDEADCRTEAHAEAVQQLPYGNGPDVRSDMSMLQWTQAIDNARYYSERRLIAACMQNKGYVLVNTPARSTP